MTTFTKEQEIEIDYIADQWLAEATKYIETLEPSTYMNKNGFEVLAYPELIYRQEGHWQGWSHFLGMDYSTQKNQQQDELENEAWKRINTEHTNMLNREIHNF